MGVHDPYNLIQKTGISADTVYHPDDIKKYVELSTNVLAGLDTTTRKKFIDLYQLAFKRGLLPWYFSGKRSFEKQQELRDKYLSGQGNIAAPAGGSYHNYGRAVDMIVLRTTGQGQRPGGLEAMNQLQKELGLNLKWGKSFNDPSHFADTRDSITWLQENDPEFQAWKSQAGLGQSDMEELDNWQEGEEQPKPTWLERNKGWLVPTLTIGLVVGLILVISNLVDEN